MAKNYYCFYWTILLITLSCYFPKDRIYGSFHLRIFSSLHFLSELQFKVISMSANLASFHQIVQYVHVLTLTHLSKNAALKGRIKGDSILLWWVGPSSQLSTHTATHALPSAPHSPVGQGEGTGRMRERKLLG